MDIPQALVHQEQAVTQQLRRHQEGIDDRTGKGLNTERVIEDELLNPYLPHGLRCAKGTVVTSEDLSLPSGAIDRVVVDVIASPLIDGNEHSVFPIEVVRGAVEITMRLDATKLASDVERLASVQRMRKRTYLSPTGSIQSTTGGGYAIAAGLTPQQVPTLAARGFIVGLPADENWSRQAITEALQRALVTARPNAHVHGLYVLGVGFFSTNIANEDGEFGIEAWTGPDRLFRFTRAFGLALRTWSAPVPAEWPIDLSAYVEGQAPHFLPPVRPGSGKP